jgi:hypothetical protein
MKLTDLTHISSPTLGAPVTTTTPYPQNRAWLESHWMPFSANRSFTRA